MKVSLFSRTQYALRDLGQLLYHESSGYRMPQRFHRCSFGLLLRFGLVLAFTGKVFAATSAPPPTNLVNLYSYCPKNQIDGVTDNTSCYKAAIFAVCAKPPGLTTSSGGGQLLVPPGVIVLSSVPIPCNGVKIHNSGNGNPFSGASDYRGTVYVSAPGNSKTMFYSDSTGGQNYGDGFEFSDAAIDASNMIAGGTVFDISWQHHATVKNVSVLNPYNFLKQQGGAVSVVEDISIMNLRNAGIEFYGSNGSNGRADLLRVNRVSMTSKSKTATCFLWHDFAQTLELSNTVCETPYIGLNVYCNESAATGSGCPAFGRFYNTQFEGCLYRCINIADGQDMEFNSTYVLGDQTTSDGGAADFPVAVFNTSLNGNKSGTGSTYAAGFRWHGGRIGNANKSCMYLGTTDAVVDGAQMFNCDLLNQHGAAIEVATSSTNNTQRVVVSNNILCSVSGQEAGVIPTSVAVLLDSGVDFVNVHDNITQQCAKYNNQTVINNSGGSHIVMHDN